MTLLSTYTPTQAREKGYYPGSLNRLFDRFFEDQAADNRQYFALPPANIAEGEKHFRIELAVPGYNKSDFNIELNEDLLNVSLKESDNKEEKNNQDNSSYVKREFGFDGFCRSFRLSDKVDRGNIKAKYENGILMITIPKKKEMLNRSIDIS
ncbi:MAG: Hsp20/alpha crystallin family protein [Bacteroidales bacterium]|nr:Hsp20/alpha crystallin family protein [Bacteroidales bacterium]